VPDSRDYLANLGIGTGDLERDKNVVVSIVGTMGEKYQGFEKIAERVTGVLLGTGRAGKEAAGGIAASGKAAAEGSAAWQKYVKQLEAADQAYKSFRRDQITGETSKMSRGGDTSAYATDQLREYIQIDDARTASFMSNARRRVAAEDRAVADSIAAVERGVAANIAAYTAEYETAAALDARLAAEQEARRSAVPHSAASSTALMTHTDRANMGVAQEGYHKQELGDMAAYYRELEREAAANERTSHEIDAMWRQVERNRLAEEARITAETNRQMEIRAAAYMREREAEQKALSSANDGLSNQRYALYDVATTYGIIGGALLGVSAAQATTAANFESGFTAVQRTSEGSSAEVEKLRQDLTDLSTEIPVTFDQLSKIAALGNQLGVKAGDVEGFTTTVAKFSTATGMTVEATAQAFGKLSNILGLSGRDYEKLGSSIVLTGRTSAATESEIVSLAERLGSTAKMAGFTADNVIGLAGAFGSLAIAPERGQGVMETYFNTLNEAVAEGGDKLQYFSQITGISSDKLSEMVRNGQGLKVFRDFLGGMSTGDTVQVTAALDALGLSGLRTNDVVKRLTQNLPLLDSSMANAAQGYGQGTELSRQFAMALDDVASRWQIFLNSLAAFGAEMGGDFLPVLGQVLALGTGFLNWLRDINSDPFAHWLMGSAQAFVVLVGVMFTFQAASALATASTYALVTAQAALQAKGAGTGMLGLVSALFGINTAARTAAVGETIAGNAATTMSTKMATATRVGRNLYTVMGRLGVIALASMAMGDFGGTIGWVADMIDALGSAIMGFGNLMGWVASLPLQAQSALSGNSKQLDMWNKSMKTADKTAHSVLGGFTNWIRGMAPAKKSTEGLADGLADIAAQADPVGKVGGNLDNIGDSAAAAQKEVHTLADYANDLQGVFSRAFDIRFGGEKAMDTITSGWASIAKGIADARQQIAEYQATMQSLTSDKSIRQYWLSVAETFGNTLRAGELRAELAEIDAKLAKNSTDMAAAQDKASTNLDGTSDAAIANRSAILGLVQDYEAYITALASSGASQDELNRKAAEAKAQFIDQATALGFPIDQVMRYAQAFGDVTIAINGVPRNITVAANTNPGMQALNEFEARMRSMAGNNYSGGTVSPKFDNSSIISGIEAQIRGLDQLIGVKTATGKSAKSEYQDRAALSAQLKAVRGYYEGGATSGGINDIAGVVHGQEYVLNHVGAQMFPRTMLDAANKGQSPFYAGAAKDKGSSNGMGMMELGPTSLGAIRAIAAQEVALYLGDTDVARAARRGNSELAMQGEF
jgi:TP901 family phage tail tape measure protein